MMFAHIPTGSFDRMDLARRFLRLAKEGLVPKDFSPGHHDGWGMTLYKKGELVHTFRTEESGSLAADVALAPIERMFPDTVLMHVRRASIGEPAERNSHPFVSGRFSFIHNGTLGPPDQDIFKDVDGKAIGETDTERYFHLIIRDFDTNGLHDPVIIKNAIHRTVAVVRVETSFMGKRYSSASSILSDGKRTYVLREYDEFHPVVEKHDAHEYYSLFLGEGTHGEIMVCSEKLEIPGISWGLLGNHTLTTIDLESNTWRTEKI